MIRGVDHNSVLLSSTIRDGLTRLLTCRLSGLSLGSIPFHSRMPLDPAGKFWRGNDS